MQSQSLTKRVAIVLFISFTLIVGQAGTAAAVFFDDAPYYQYGDFQSYALGLLNYLATGKEKGSGGVDYSVASSPGQLKDAIVLYTDPGKPDNPNQLKNNESTSINDAFDSVTGSGNSYFSTSLSQFIDPGVNGAGAGTGDVSGGTTNSWDISLDSLRAFLGGGDLVFFFNNNQTGSGLESISLYAYGQLELVDLDGGADPFYLDFTNTTSSGGVPGGDVTSYTSTGKTTVAQPDTFDAASPDANYVFVPGELCFDNALNLVSCALSSKKDPLLHIDTNLGANEASYALFSPELQWILDDPSSPFDIIRADFRLATLNNGYEQLFILALPGQEVPVPEPSTLILLLTGLAVLVICDRSRRRKNRRTLSL